jgi:acetolactate synthase-1/2/3 large subunit
VRWDDRVAQKVGEAGLEADIAYIDINAQKVQEVRMSRRPKFSIIGDAGTALEDLLAYVADHPVDLDITDWQQRVIAMKKALSLDYNRNAESIQQAEVMEALSRYSSDDMLLTTGVGNHQMLAAQYLKITRPRSFLTSGGFGVMGFSLPSAVGAHFARPNDTIIAIDGDGSLRMNMGELYTIGTNNLPIKVLLLNNHSIGMVRNIQTARYGGCIVATEESNRVISFANLAKECGFSTVMRVDQRKDLYAAIELFLKQPGQAFLEVVTDVNEVVYPVIAPGQGYKDMNLGPYINTNGMAEGWSIDT